MPSPLTFLRSKIPDKLASNHTGHCVVFYSLNSLFQALALYPSLYNDSV